MRRVCDKTQNLESAQKFLPLIFGYIQLKLRDVDPLCLSLRKLNYVYLTNFVNRFNKSMGEFQLRSVQLTSTVIK